MERVRMPDRSRCPSCGERVSPFAAGCAICGADLDVRRWDSGPDVVTRIGSRFSALTSGPRRGGSSLVWIAILLVFGGTIAGALIAALSGVFG
jgi:uncharacterized protein (DUF983 family)